MRFKKMLVELGPKLGQIELINLSLATKFGEI